MSSSSACPVCGLEGGFHDHDVKDGKHAQHEVPRELLKEPGWAKQAHEELKREIREKEAEAEAEAWAALNAILGIDQEEHAEQIAAIAAEIDDDKQGKCVVVDDFDHPVGESFYVLGTKPTDHFEGTNKEEEARE